MVTIGGEDYRLRFTMDAWRIMEEEHGLTLGELSERFRAEDDQRAGAVVTMLSALVRAGGSVPRDIPETELLARLGRVQPQEYFQAVLGANMAIKEGLRSAHKGTPGTDAAIDPTLAQLDREHGAADSLTWRQTLAWGLIAGLSYREQMDMAPGLVIDCYLYRQAYDDTQHHIKRKQPETPIDAGVNWEEE